MAFIVMAYIVMAFIVMAFIVMAFIVMAYIVMAFIFIAYIVMAYIVMAYIVMAYRVSYVHSYGRQRQQLVRQPALHFCTAAPPTYACVRATVHVIVVWAACNSGVGCL